MPAVERMMRFMTDKEIADKYEVKCNAFIKVRKQHGRYRDGESALARVYTHNPATCGWDFSGQDLPI